MTRLVADSGPLIALASSDHLGLLTHLASEVLVPSRVVLECTEDLSWPGAESIARAVSDGALRRIEVQALGDFQALAGLDVGESEVLAAAQIEQAIVLMDDAIGRGIARAHGIPVVGACGVLLWAKQEGLVGMIGPILQTWRVRIGYHLSEALIQEVLRRAEE